MMDLTRYIEINPEVRFGKPVIKGSRITVGDILGWLANDMSYAEIMNDYPILKEEHIRAALVFAANREAMVKIIVG